MASSLARERGEAGREGPGVPVAALPPCLLPALREEGAQVSLATGAPVVADQIAIQPLQLRERIIGEVVQQILHINGGGPSL